MVSFKGILVNKESTSNDVMYRLESCFLISSANENVSDTVCLLIVNSLSKGTKNFAKLYVDVPIADRIGRKEDKHH